VPAEKPLRGGEDGRIYNLLVHGELYQKIPIRTTGFCPLVERVSSTRAV
jgi:hypothetical protein